MDEFEKLVPSKIDRDEMKDLPIGNLSGGSIAGIKSDEKWTQRCKEMTKLTGINFCSRHIPTMIETFDKHIGACPINQEIDLTKVFTKVAFKIITKIFFGKDITENMEKMEYTCPFTGQKSMLKFQDFYPKCVRDQLATFVNPLGKIFSFLASYNLIEPYKSNAKNLSTCHRSLVNYLDTCKDQESIYYQLYKSGNLTQYDFVMDACQMLFAGFDTSSRSLSASELAFTKKPPKSGM